jgi:hypothetical protein
MGAGWSRYPNHGFEPDLQVFVPFARKNARLGPALATAPLTFGILEMKA